MPTIEVYVHYVTKRIFESYTEAWTELSNSNIPAHSAGLAEWQEFAMRLDEEGDWFFPEIAAQVLENEVTK